MTGHGTGGRIPLLLLPGTLCDHELWEYQARSLADIAAPHVADLTRDDSIVGMAERTLQAAPPHFLLAGLSMGGIVGFEITRRSPGRVLGLALLNTNPAVADDTQVAVWREEIEMTEHGLFGTLLEERWIPSLLAASGSQGLSLRHTIHRMARHIGPDSYVRQLRAQIGRPDSWPSLAAIACPTFVLGGRQDTMCPPTLHEAMAAAIPGARLAIVEDCGHLSALEQPEAVTALLRSWVERSSDAHHLGGAPSVSGHHA